MIFDSLNPKYLESRGESFGGVLNSMFSVKDRGWFGVVKFVVTLALFGWTVDSILPIVHDTALWLFGLQPETFKPADEYLKNFVKLLVPVALFGLAVTVLYLNRRRTIIAESFDVTDATPRKCLIYMLSTYNPRNAMTLDEVIAAVENDTLDIDALLKTNWGNLAFTVLFHASVLERVYLVTTMETSSEYGDHLYEKARTLIEYLVRKSANRKVVCTEENIGQTRDDSNDIGKVGNTIKRIYERLDEDGLGPGDAVANITGGNSAMSGGMILATLAEERSIEYIRQGPALSLELLKTGGTMLAPKTNYRFTK